MTLAFEGQEQSLEEVLASRELRQRRQQELLSLYDNTLVSFKLNIPGPVKYNPLIKKIFEEGLKELHLKLNSLSINILIEKVFYEATGPEYLAMVDKEALEIKKITTDIEDTHPLGRVYDFDVWKGSEKQLSRRDMGLGPRRCFLCQEPAFVCARSRKHSLEEMLSHIETMAQDYFHSNIK